MGEVRASFGVRVTAFGLRHAPSVTNWVSNKAATVAAPVVRAVSGREYCLGETRLAALKYNFREYFIEPQPIRQARTQAVRGYLDEFLTALEAVMPSRLEGAYSLATALAGARNYAETPRQEAIIGFIRSELPKYRGRQYGSYLGDQVLSLASGWGIDKEYKTPEIEKKAQRILDSLVSANLYSWFIGNRGPVLHEVYWVLQSFPRETLDNWPRTLVAT